MGTWLDIFPDGKVYEMEGDRAIGVTDTNKEVAKLISLLQNSHSGMYAIAPVGKVPPTIEKPKISREVPQSAIDLIKEFEGYHDEQPDGRSKAYKDPIYGWEVPTIGYGTTFYPDGRQVQKGDIITREQAEQYLKWEVEEVCCPALEKIPTWGRMNQNQRGALYSFAYNLGAFYRAPDRESITKVCDSPDRWNDKEWIAEQFVKYRDPGSDAEEGLKRRRLREADLFCS